jgi:hypothetical protein
LDANADVESPGARCRQREILAENDEDYDPNYQDTPLIVAAESHDVASFSD